MQQNIRDLIRRKKELNKRGPIIRAQMVEIPYVLHEVEDFKKEFGDKADIISINRLEAFSQNVDANNPNGRTILNESIPKCNRLEREDFFVFSNGSVSCCDTDFDCTLNIGNVNEQSVREIYNGAKYQGLIGQYREGRLHKIELCSKCRDFNL